MKENIKKILFGIIAILIIIIVWQCIKIFNLNKKTDNPPSPFPYEFYDAGDEGFIGGYISAKGTWESNLKLAYPYNINQIDCWKQWNNCIVAQAYTTGENSFGGANMINNDINYYEIESWDSYKVIAKNTALCAETVLTVDRTLEKITTITTPINTETEGCKAGRELMGDVEVQTSILVDGSKKWIDEFITHKK